MVLEGGHKNYKNEKGSIVPCHVPFSHFRSLVDAMELKISKVPSERCDVRIQAKFFNMPYVFRSGQDIQQLQPCQCQSQGGFNLLKIHGEDSQKNGLHEVDDITYYIIYIYIPSEPCISVAAAAAETKQVGKGLCVRSGWKLSLLEDHI